MEFSCDLGGSRIHGFLVLMIYFSSIGIVEIYVDVEYFRVFICDGIRFRF